MRLPSYRSSHMRRYHPYPRVRLGQREILTRVVEENDTSLQTNGTLSNDNAELGDTLEPNALPGNGEQERNALNLLEVVEVPEAAAGGGLRVRHRKLMAFIIVALLFVARILAFNV